MSYEPHAPPGAPGIYNPSHQIRKGSAPTARERVRTLPQSQIAQPVSRSQPLPTSNQQQWPLPVAPASESRRVPPPRPARGPDVPPIPTNIYGNSQNLTPRLRRGQYPLTSQGSDEEHLIPTYGSSQALGQPLTTSSIASFSSSIETIPDFPFPSTQLPPIRRPQQIGPPPSARRGPSSYYSQLSQVSPIYEEAERTSVRSLVSSSVIPSTAPEFYLEEGEGETPSDEEDEATGALNRTPSADHNEQSSLVRQASIGKRTKPTLTSIRSAESGRAEELAVYRSEGLQRSYIPSLQIPPLIIPQKATRLRLRDSSLLFDDSSPSPEELSMNFGDPRNTKYPYANDSPSSPEVRLAPRPPINLQDSRLDEIFGGPKGAGIQTPAAAKEVRQSIGGTLANRMGSKRPLRLNIDAVREAEARGSLTSLPDLIRRATRLASNLDRGKTASRLGQDWVNPGEEEKRRKSGGGLSGILAAFPPPGVRTPATPITNWPSKNVSRHSLDVHRKYESQNTTGKAERRFCGMPLWGLIVVMFIILLLAAAAVVLPVVLIVLPNQRAITSNADAGAAGNGECSARTPCSNAGTSVRQEDGSCACLCTNGFMGPQCKTAGDAGCTTISVAGVKSVSIGKELPTLFGAASKTYSIPLSETKLLTLFSATGMTCGSENALVTFSGSSSTKRSMVDARVGGSLRATRKERSTPVATTDGVAGAGSSTKATPTTPKAGSTTTPVVISTGDSAPGTNATAKEFAKIGILFVFQESRQVDVAVQAQTAVSAYMESAIGQGSTMSLAQNVRLGNGYFIDLWFWTVTLSNGTIYGDGYNGTATTLLLN